MAKGSKSASRRGRPPSPLDETKRHAFGFRTTKRIKDMIEHASRESGRSIAHEIEMRIENSFYDEYLADQCFEAAYGKRAAALMRLVAWAMHSAGTAATEFQYPNRSWYLYPQPYDQVVKAAIGVLERFRPEGNPKEFRIPADLEKPKGNLVDFLNSWINGTGERVATDLVEAVSNPENYLDLGSDPDADDEDRARRRLERSDVLERARPIREKLGPELANRAKGRG